MLKLQSKWIHFWWFDNRSTDLDEIYRFKMMIRFGHISRFWGLKLPNLKAESLENLISKTRGPEDSSISRYGHIEFGSWIGVNETKIFKYRVFSVIFLCFCLCFFCFFLCEICGPLRGQKEYAPTCVYIFYRRISLRKHDSCDFISLQCE